MNTTTTYSPDQARKDYKPMLKRSAVLELGGRFGITARGMRKLIEGTRAKDGKPATPPALTRRRFAGQRDGYFDLEEVLRAIQ